MKYRQSLVWLKTPLWSAEMSWRQDRYYYHWPKWKLHSQARTEFSPHISLQSREKKKKKVTHQPSLVMIYKPEPWAWVGYKIRVRALHYFLALLFSSYYQRQGYQTGTTLPMQKATELLNLASWQGTSAISATPAQDISRLVNYVFLSLRETVQREENEQHLVLSLATENGAIRFYLKLE